VDGGSDQLLSRTGLTENEDRCVRSRNLLRSIENILETITLPDNMVESMFHFFPVAAKGHVAHRGKIVELGVALQPCIILAQPRFRPPAQLGRVRCRGFVLCHGVAFLSRFFLPAWVCRNCASNRLAAVMSEKVITTPSIRFSRVR